MLELPHAIVGATIAIKIGNPLLSLPLSLLSHFALDLLPHWNPNIFTEVKKYGKVSSFSKKIILVDSFLALIIGSLLAISFYPNFGRIITVLLGCFLAVLPDVAEVPFFFAGSQNKHLTTYIKLHRRLQFSAPLKLGIITQTIVLALCFLIIFSS